MMRGLPVGLSLFAFCAAGAITAFAADDPLSTWHARKAPDVTVSLTAAAYGGGRWIACGDEGVLLHSTDGESWERTSSPTSKDLYSAVFANGLFVVGGSERAILTSTNGVDWISHSGVGTSPNFGAAFGNGRFVLAGGSRTYFSEDGETWLARLNAFDDALSGLTFGTVFVAAGYDDDNVGSIFTSPDGESWEPRNPGTSAALLGAGFGGGTYVAVAELGGIVVSTNAIDWSARTSGTANDLWDVEFGHGNFVAVGWAGTILTSGDGNTWTPRSSGTTNALYGVNYGGGRFITVGRNGTILLSKPFPQAEFSLASPAKAAGEFRFELRGTPGRSYDVQRTTDFKTWSTLTNVVFSGSSIQCVLPAQTGERAFYRGALRD